MKKYFILIVLTFLISSFKKSLYAGPDNIAIIAKATASSEWETNYAANINDGIIGISGKGEWASTSKENLRGKVNYPWVQLTWDETQCIDRVVFYDRVDLNSHLAGGSLIFSDGTEMSVNLIPNDGSARVVEFESKEVDWIRFEVSDGTGEHMGLSEIEVFPSADGALEPAYLVDPYIETTRGRYFFFITGGRPFGMIGSAPLTRNKNQMGGGYNYNSTEILSFPQIHGWMLSGLEFMPTTGKTQPTRWHDGWKSNFSHNSEIVQPGYHRVFLDKHQVWVEQTATERVSFYRMTYTEDNDAAVLLNLGGFVGTSTMVDADVRKVSDYEIEGSFNSIGRVWGGPLSVKVFFVARIDKPMQRMDSWSDTVEHQGVTSLVSEHKSIPRGHIYGDYHDAPTAGVQAQYKVQSGDTIQVKLSISYTSIDNARINMDSECAHWDFDEVRKETRDTWNNWLGKIAVQGGETDQRIKFYTDLWHVLLGRHKLNDVTGDYPDYTSGERIGNHTDARLVVRSLPKDEKGNLRYNMYNSDAFWLTQWNLNTLWGLGWPSVLDDFSASLVQYADNGNLLPRGPCAGGYSYIMTGCPATNLIVSAYMKGLLHRTSSNHAFQVMKQNHQPGGMMGGDEINFYVENGWKPNNAGETLEWAFQDWSLSQMAKKLGKEDDYEYFLKRSSGWKNLYNPEVGLLLPKKADGSWLHTDPLSGRGWVQANSWQATWSVSHDVSGLADLMGGNDVLAEKLNYAFSASESQNYTGYGSGHISYANQPGCSNAHVFNYAGKAWLSQYWVRNVYKRFYSNVTPDKGYGGFDEDQGQMGGISALMALGLFSLQGTASAEPVYEITSPVFDQIVIKLDKEYYTGDTFTIKTYNNSFGNMYIQKAKLNGASLDRFWFSHDEFSRGGVLELWLGPEPNKDWGTSELP